MYGHSAHLRGASTASGRGPTPRAEARNPGSRGNPVQPGRQGAGFSSSRFRWAGAQRPPIAGAVGNGATAWTRRFALRAPETSGAFHWQSWRQRLQASQGECVTPSTATNQLQGGHGRSGRETLACCRGSGGGHSWRGRTSTRKPGCGAKCRGAGEMQARAKRIRSRPVTARGRTNEWGTIRSQGWSCSCLSPRASPDNWSAARERAELWRRQG